jgi:type VII secretion integral membrane protein EccD
VNDERCRITVVGKRRRVDLAVPARAPIAEYIPNLTRMCGQESDETLPAAWSLALAGDRPFPPSISLLEAQVSDGATLYLRDLVEGETDGPLVTDLEDLVGDMGDQWERWNTRHRALTVIGIGVGGYLVALATLVLSAPDQPLAGIVSLVTGFALALVAGIATRRRWPVPARLRLAVALSAIPALGLAGYALPVSRGSDAAAIAVVAGANVGAVAALIAMLNVWTLTAELFAVAALPVTVLLSLLHATRVECAAVTGVAALLLLSATPSAAGRLTTLPPTHGAAAAPLDPEEEVAAMLRRSRRVLVTLALTLSLVVAACLVVLGGSTDPYAAGLALCLSLALLAQAGHSNVPVAVMLVSGAGAVGLITLVIRTPATFLHASPTGLGAFVACGISVITLCAGIAMTMPPSYDVDARPAWLGSVAVMLSVLSMPLAVGVFGVFEYLAGVGGRL